MLFNSFSFAIFFPAVTLAYFATPHKARWAVLLVASCLFYMAFIPQYILILAFAIVIDYFAGILLEDAGPRRRKPLLWASLASNLGLLFVFKYFKFFNTNVAALAALLHWNYSAGLLQIALPIGLSFHTFQSLAYVIEVYRGTQTAERHFGIYALYVMFYPQLVAGPIERPGHLLHQFHQNHYFDEARVVSGLKTMAVGLFKKVVVADRLAVVVNHVYDHPGQYSGIPLIVATVAFAFQIYCDFSGYSDVAIGAARVMGFELRTNFNFPYVAQSVPEFWRRWHMSLSTWFRDYVYIPMGGSRVGRWRLYFNLAVVFVVSGLWHGAAWTFAIWGALHALFMVLSNVKTELGKRGWRLDSLLPAPLLAAARLGLTFVLVCYAWIFFRAGSLQDALYIGTHVFAGIGTTAVQLLHHNAASLRGFTGGASNLAIACAALVALLVFEHFQRRGKELFTQPALSWGFMAATLLLIINLAPAQQVPFIYFQF